MRTNRNKRDARQSDASSKVELDRWVSATVELGELGGSIAQADGLRLQFKKQWVGILEPFANQQWFGWVPGELCCRFAPACAKGLFLTDLERWQSRPGHEHLSLPSGDTPVKTSYERRGRLTLPESIAAVNIKRSQLLLVGARRGFIEIWIPEAFAAYCTHMASPFATGDSMRSRPVPQNSGVCQGQPN